MKNNFLYIANQRMEVSEGGMSRNNAFYHYFTKNKYQVINAYDSNYLKRFYKNILFLIYSLFFKNKKIVIHQSSIILLFPIITWRYFNVVYQIYFKNLAKRNQLFIEINDLPVEQAYDLELKISENYIIFQNILYSLKNCHYIYASNEMEKYVRMEYKQNRCKNQVIINGGNKLQNNNNYILTDLNIEINKSKINYIYAGSLNRGRQIEILIDVFQDREQVLYLIGENGEWINSLNLTNNIKYLGSFKENDAQIITSNCDIGIIPYDESRFYYNLCYPTKASFYLCSKIPILSTKLYELSNVLKDQNAAYFISSKDFPDFITRLSKKELETKKKNTVDYSELYTWEHILSNLKIN